MEISVRGRDEVWTTDDYRLGLARCLHYRAPHEVNPDEQLYAVYLEVVNYEMGDAYYIPTDFLISPEPDTNRVTLNASMKDVMQRTWSREPDFVAMRLGRSERLDEVRIGERPAVPAAGS